MAGICVYKSKRSKLLMVSHDDSPSPSLVRSVTILPSRAVLDRATRIAVERALSASSALHPLTLLRTTRRPIATLETLRTPHSPRAGEGLTVRCVIL